MVIVSARPDKFFILRATPCEKQGRAEIRKRVALGEAHSEEFHFTLKARSQVHLSSEIPYLKITPKEFQNNNHQRSKVQFEFRSPFAGTYSSDKLRADFLGPLKLFATASKIEAVSFHYIVYPKIHDVALQSSKILGKSGIGEIAIDLPGIGTEFYDMREYQQGDDFRNVNWKASARLGELIVKDRAREVVTTYYLVLEALSTSYFDRDRLATAFLQIANSLALVGANFGIITHDGTTVISVKELDKPSKSLFFALSAALDFTELSKERKISDQRREEEIWPLPSHVIKASGDALSKQGLKVLSQIETLGQHQMTLAVKNNDVFKEIMGKVKENASAPPAIFYICELTSSPSIASIIETASELKGAYNADFVVIDPTLPWVVAGDEVEAAMIYETHLKKLKILANARVRYLVGDPLKVAEQSLVA